MIDEQTQQVIVTQLRTATGEHGAHVPTVMPHSFYMTLLEFIGEGYTVARMANKDWAIAKRGAVEWEIKAA